MFATGKSSPAHEAVIFTIFFVIFAAVLLVVIFAIILLVIVIIVVTITSNRVFYQFADVVILILAVTVQFVATGSKFTLPSVFRPILLFRCTQIPVRVPRTGIQVVTFLRMEVVPMISHKLSARQAWFGQIVVFTLLPLGTAEESAPLIAVTAILQVKRHPINHRQAEEEARAVAVVVGVKAPPFTEMPCPVSRRVDLENGHCEHLACKGEGDKSVSFMNLFDDITKNLSREKQDCRLIYGNRLAEDKSYSCSLHGDRRLGDQSFGVKTSLFGNSRAL